MAKPFTSALTAQPLGPDWLTIRMAELENFFAYWEEQNGNAIGEEERGYSGVLMTHIAMHIDDLKRVQQERQNDRLL